MTQYNIGKTMCDMHGKALRFAPTIKGVKWIEWVHINADVPMPSLPYIGTGGGYCNKYLSVIADGVVACRYDNHHYMVGTFEEINEDDYCWIKCVDCEDDPDEGDEPIQVRIDDLDVYDINVPTKHTHQHYKWSMWVVA